MSHERIFNGVISRQVLYDESRSVLYGGRGRRLS